MAASANARTSPVVLWRLLIAAGLLVTVVGGMVAWRAVERLDEAWARYVVVRTEMGDLQTMLRERLDEASGRNGLDLGFRTSDDDLQAQLDDLVERAGDDGSEIADEVVARESDLLESARADDDEVIDERLLVRLDSALQDLDRAVVRPVSKEASDERGTTRTTIVVVTVLSAVLWGGVALLAWRGPRRSSSAHRVA